MKAPVNSRYAHCEGITDIAAYETEEGKLLTCGSDGDVRLWKGPEDQDPVVFSATDACLCLSSHKDTLYVGTENNSVESYALPTGKPKGVVAKFTAAVNHLDISKSGKIVVAGSGDMTFQIIKLDDKEKPSGPPTKVEGHLAPVLAVLIDPKEEFIVSCGCDGAVCIWTMSGKQIKNWDKVFPSSNDIMTSQTLCRPSWHPSGKFLAIPKKDHVILYSRTTWEQGKVLKTSQSTKMLSVSRFSSCGKFLAVGSADGTVIVWDVESGKLLYENVDTRDHITGLIFSKCNKDIFAVDIKGRMIFIKNFNTSYDTQNFDFDDELNAGDENEVQKGVVAEEDPFDDDMDGMVIDDDPDGNEFSISRIKAMSGFISSEKDDVFVGIDKAKKMAGIQTENSAKKPVDDDALSVSSIDEDNWKTEHQSKSSQKVVMPFTELQKPFQPASSPAHLEHRFMVWNSIGIIRNYTMEDDDMDAIDIEFHDVSFHNGIHLRNQFEYSIAALGKEAVVFASRMHKDAKSKLMCLHFSSSDKNKEWSVDLPIDEDITGLAVGTGWVAAATDMNRLRIFSVGGFQKDVLELGGQIIAISGHEDLLFVTFHNGIGLHGNQCVAYSILKIRNRTGVFPLISNEPLSLSPKSQLAWIGFSDEGMPAFSDSRESLRILSGRMWITFLNMKENLSGESDHFWVTGISVCSQHVRAIKCKGTRYPAALPRPTIMLLDAKLPLCELETEKSQHEELLLRSIMLNSVTKKMDKKGFDVENYKDKAERDIKESLMKLFALCCKGDRDYRASEYVTVMPSTHAIQVAVKYANKLRKMALTDRLTAIGRKKMDEEEEGVEEDDDDFENMRSGNVIYSSVYTSLGNNTNNATGYSFSGSQDLYGNTSSCMNQSNDLGILEENPLLSKQRAEIRSILSPNLYTNKFKKDKDGKICANTAEVDKTDADNGKGVGLIDAWKKPVDKPSTEFNPKHPKNKTTKKAAAEKGKAAPKPKKQQQQTLFQMKGKSKKSNEEENPPSPMENSIDESSNNSVDFSDKVLQSSMNNSIANDSEPEKDHPLENPTKKIGFLLWFDEYKTILESENPDASVTELTKLGTRRFKTLSPEEKKKYMNPQPAEGVSTEKKRKRNEVEDVDSKREEADKKSRITSKLAAFVKRSD